MDTFCKRLCYVRLCRDNGRHTIEGSSDSATKSTSEEKPQGEVAPMLRPTQGPGSRSSSKFVGVTQSKATGKWAAQAYLGGRVTPLGTFESEWAAGLAYAQKMHALNVRRLIAFVICCSGLKFSV